VRLLNKNYHKICNGYILEGYRKGGNKVKSLSNLDYVILITGYRNKWKGESVSTHIQFGNCDVTNSTCTSYY
jgi:hypothetical protein